MAIVMIPESVTEIGWGAFYNCTSLKKSSLLVKWQPTLLGLTTARFNVMLAFGAAEGESRAVATRCDLDGSGDLDLRELNQAARVCGIPDRSGALQEVMDGQCISKESFTAMVATQADQSHATIGRTL